MKFKKIGVTAFLSVFFLVSCSKDTIETTKYVPLGSYDSGVLVLNQGGFNVGNATVSFISYDLNTLQNNIFSLVNPTVTLGDTGQDIGFNNELAYIVLNNSSKIQIVNRYTMEDVGSITSGLSNPRYIAFANNKAYVTNWGDANVASDDYVAVINLVTNTVSSTIPVAEGPERILENNGKLYVTHTGGYHQGNSVSVIDESTSAVSSIVVGDVPNEMQINEGVLWVSCSGNPSYAATETAGKFVKINLATNQVIKTYNFGAATKHPGNLTIYGTNLYYTLNKGIYEMALDAASLPNAELFTADVSTLYGFAVKSNRIYVSGYSAFDSDGTVVIYSLGELVGSDPIGTLEKTYTVGIGPCGFYFNQ